MREDDVLFHNFSVDANYGGDLGIEKFWKAEASRRMSLPILANYILNEEALKLTGVY